MDVRFNIEDKNCTRLWYLVTIFSVLFIFQTNVSLAQFTDDFSDGDFTDSPAWTTDQSDKWTVDNTRLRSNSSTANDNFWISTPSARATQTQWEFWINLQFNTSSANLVDVYLVSENENLVAAGNNGYFVRIGGTPDEISLFKIVNGTATIIIDGTNGITNFSNNVFKIKVIRDENNVWTLSYDNTGTGSYYFSEPPVTDNSFNSGNYFGIRILQSTATFFNRHFFDDFYVGDIIVDTEPPAIASAIPVSSTVLDVVFSEKVEITSAQATINYSVNNSIGNPLSAVRQSDDRTVRLTFNQSFPNAASSQLTVTNVEDLFGNAIASTQADFFFFQQPAIEYKDIIFTEIFADPSPVIGLPEAEFVELFNRSNKPININGWKFSDPSSTATLPDYILMPGAFIIITPNASVSAFATFGTVRGVSNFPTLNNAGDNLVLRDNASNQIDEVNYTDAWYKDDDKRQGGWTLELIDTENICAEEENWTASINTSGGTPGQENSVKDEKPDLTGPKLLSAMPVTSTQLKLLFDEKLDTGLPAISDFVITSSILVSSLSFELSGKEIRVDLSSPLQHQQAYNISVANIRDCSGNLIQENFRTLTFGFPEEAQPLDVVINEILFNPKPFGVDFLEVYNRSSKYINLKEWSIGNYEQNVSTNAKAITSSDFLLPPGTIFAFTTDPFTIQSHYPSANKNALIKINSMPSFPDNEGSASVINAQGVVIDHYRYTKDNHSVFLRDKEGVSLERIYAYGESNDPNNWKSAAATVGYATPGYKNSNTINSEIIAGEVSIMPEIFVPLFGQPDFTEIRYSFDRGGRVANIKVLDQQGREIKKLANNETLAIEGFYRWDGDRDDGTKARPGYYVVWFEVFDTSGRVDTFRKRVIVAARY